ncbi:MAG: family 20 glycosylhydrolase [Kiritimatiellia bacterium]|jgi:hexosaminidase|nr:family 20 glycosylhydrolase [Kiritimatiellia bacterium]MDP6630760.1 family 20 glycosylhydrolase [Kiritimatiellia bacterium]MDP6809377.1 family 20 glycosylhydrolase [Kiritimatiellia bacterium]MDP7023946.1 family 20 glycosylhydrolase [Kiritimatiellia bacterium]
MPFDTLFPAATPAIPQRGVHLDLKGVPPTAERLLSLLDLFAAARYNVVLVEWEDSFPWTVDERFRSPTAYTAAEVTAFCEKAAALGLELIPLVQCLGHMETPLSVPGYEKLREIPDFEAGLNPLAPGARDLIQGMVDDVLTLMPGVKHFHLGGDEARTFGQNPETRAYVEEHGKGALYLHHVEPILDNLKARDIRPILWHDMMIDWDSAALRALAAKCDLMPWVYGGDPAAAGAHCNRAIIERFSEHGFTLWGGAAYKGAEGYDADIPDVALHVENALAWVAVAREYDFVGVVATAWSRYAVDTVQCNPIDSSLDALLSVAVILHEGELPAGGVATCVAALAGVGEKDRFDACRQAMEKLAALRREGWEKVQHARQVMVLAKAQPLRTSAGNPKLGLHALTRLGELVEQAEAVAEETRAAFAGLISEIWINEYLDTRLQPLRDELTLLNKENRS